MLGMVAVLGALAVSEYVRRSGEGRLYDNLADLPAHRVALVLGCPPRIPGGAPNVYFQGRVRAAARLFHAGKVEYLLLSGDNRHRSYNEPQEMADALLRSGVPRDRMVLDYAGLRTLDSLIRAKEVFGQTDLIIVSQEFHNRRALFLAQRLGLDALAYNTLDAERSLTTPLEWREIGARLKAFADIYFLDTEALFLGDPIVIGGDDEQAITSDSAAADARVGVRVEKRLVPFPGLAE